MTGEQDKSADNKKKLPKNNAIKSGKLARVPSDTPTAMIAANNYISYFTNAKN